MTELLTAAQMRSIEQAAIDSGAVTGLELMERAGRGVVEAILEWLPELALAPHRAVVLCGPGNNGGDGFVVARLLKERGWEVEVFLYGDEAKLPPDAAENCRRWQEMGEINTDFSGNFEKADILVDALFGIGLSREINHQFWWMANTSPHGGLVSIDVPTGECSDSGRTIGQYSLHACLCVTFHRAKVGHYLNKTHTDAAVKVVVKDIGLKTSVWPTYRLTNFEPLEPPDWHALQKLQWHNHKYTHGHALILSGGPGKGGAARLAARGALRIGAGLVTIACPPGALQENAARLDAIMLRPVKDAEALTGLITDPRLNAVCLGPGLGVGERTRALVFAALSRAVPGLTKPAPHLMRGDLPTGAPTEGRDPGSGAGAARKKPRCIVLDADALTSFEGDPETLFAQLHDNCVLTPHGGEFKRLFPDIMAKLEAPATKGPAYSKVDATREAARRAGCTVLFKGPDTVIADQTGRAAINSAHYDRAAPWLATAGSGDVLAGFITGLMARGFSPMAAAETAAWLHVSCALKFGPGLIAEDLPEQLPAVFRDLGL